ncbi:MAG: hypothetical protein K2G30_08465 [Muribaculaceae bacterium]|nr:hypothetical protein [Muribaculaceae bacterium]
MKKLLLSALAVAACASVSAADYTVDFKNATNFQGTFVEEALKADGTLSAAPHYQPLTSLECDNFTFATESGENKSTAPAFYMTPSTNANTLPTLRLYVNNVLTITAPAGVKMGKIDFTLAKGTAGTFTTSAGSVYGISNTAMSWSATEAVETLTLTFPGTFQIKSMVVSDVPEAPVDPTPSTGLLDVAEFTSNFGFTFEDGTLPEGLSYVWTLDATYKYMKASAYYQQNNAVEAAYLVSPVVDLTELTKIDLTFAQCVGQFKDAAGNLISPADFCKICVREEGGEWGAPIDIPSFPAYNEGKNFSSFADCTMSLDAYAGKKIQIGFRYSSNTTTCGTWEIKSVKVSDGAGAGVETVEANDNAPVEYYNLQGVRVAEPANGIFIRRQGNKVTKVAL